MKFRNALLGAAALFSAAIGIAQAQPNWVPAVVIRISTRSVPDAWRDYLYWTGELTGE